MALSLRLRAGFDADPRRDRASGHSSHLGLRATHQRRPCWIMRWLKATHSRRGTTAIRSCSIFTGSFWRVSPSRRLTRATWVSTTIPEAMPKAVPRMTLAVLRPTPGSSTSCSSLVGHLAVVLLDQHAAGGLDVLGLVAEKAGALHGLFQLGQRRGGEMGRTGILAKQRRRDHVDPLVGALGREDRGHQQFQRRLEVQRALGLRDTRAAGRGLPRRRVAWLYRRRPSWNPKEGESRQERLPGARGDSRGPAEPILIPARTGCQVGRGCQRPCQDRAKRGARVSRALSAQAI